MSPTMVLKLFSGNSLRSLTLRGTAITLGGTAGQQLLRLLSNLILTRLLFPEAFGLMALIQTFTSGLQLFSDLGLRPSIIQNKRGEDPDFLNTAWTLQIIRGAVLWLVACLLAWPLSVFYDNEQILWMLPVVGLGALIQGFSTTKGIVASRNLQLGLMTTIGVISQVVGLVAMIGLAWIWPSVWALAIGGLASSLFGTWAGHRFLPGIRNRLHWDPAAAHDLLHFGRFILISTIATFFGSQGDRLFLGQVVSLADLGIYNIAFFLSVFPSMLGDMVANQILFPLYRKLPPSQNLKSQQKIRRARNLLTGGLIAMYGLLALVSVPLIELLYDQRYAAAGPMLVILALMQFPGALVVGNSMLLLAEGNSRDFSKLTIIRGVLNMIYLIGAFWLFGILGVLLAPGLKSMTLYPLQQYYVARYKGMDLTNDAIFMLISIGIGTVAVWYNWDILAEFYRTSVALAPSVTGNWHPKTVFAL